MGIKEYFDEIKTREYQMIIKEHNIEEAMKKLKEANKLFKNNTIRNVEMHYRILYK